MSYTALYRKFRPQGFEDVKGQDHIVTTLKNQIQAERIGHAYLFCGTRGTGKTSIAKIFAKAVNCEHPVEGSPCGTCAVCKSIADGTSMNVIEIDAASNNGVDNVREIIEEVAYSPTEGKYKVYIIDEVHMLSTGAFNALLKTLEEPPSYVIFILATTEVHKIPITVLSRCQRYDFKRITVDTLTQRMTQLMEEEEVEVEEKALRYIAKAADGSMRDALSLLDQCISFYLGKTLTYDNALDVLGAVDTSVFEQLLSRIVEKDITGSIAFLDELLVKGRELNQFVNDFIWYLRNLLLVKSAPEHAEEVLDVSTENRNVLEEFAKKLTPEAIMRFIRIFSDLSNQLKYTSQKRITVEIALIKLCKPEMETSYDSLYARIESLEEKIAKGIQVAPNAPAAVQAPQAPAMKEEERRALEKAIPDDIKQVVNNWASIIMEISNPLKIYLKSAKKSLGGDNRLLVVFEDSLAENYAKSVNGKEQLEKVIASKLGKHVEVEIRTNESDRPFEQAYVDIEKVINMELTIED